MKVENVAFIPDLTGAVEKAKEVSSKIVEGVDSTYRSIGRGIKRAKIATEETLEDTRDEIKEHPLTTVALVGAGAFGLGLLAGWIITRRREK